MASIFGEDGGTLAGGRRRPTNAGYNPFGAYQTNTAGAVPRSSGAGENPFGSATPRTSGGTRSVYDNTIDPENGYHVNSPEWVEWTNTHHPEFGSGASPNPQPSPYHFDWLHGYDQGKFNDPTKIDAKYQIGRVLSQFDPHGGVTDPVLRMLDALGYGKFYGSGDELGIKGVTAAGQQMGLDPHDFSGDFIEGFHSANPFWTYDAYSDPFTTAAEPPPADPFAGSAGFPGSPGASPFTIINNPAPGDSSHILDALNAIMASAQQTQEGAVSPYVPTMQAPPLMLDGGGNGLGRALQLLALRMPGATGQQAGPTDPLTAWLMSILGQGGTA